MNAVTTHNHKTNTFKWLLKREFWENRGGFLWAPVITGAIVSLLTLVLAVIGLVRFNQSHAGDSMRFEGSLAEHARQIGGIGDTALLVGISLTTLVLAFVVFFYALGCLYDDRRDRSVLFWKSLPASDLQMVLSKASWALLLAPIISIVVGVAIGIVLWVIIGAAAALAGMPNASAIFTHANPFSVIGNTLTIVPVYLLWALPAVGWLMLCSAWARSKPFLWAVLLPVLACVMVSMVGILPGTDINYGRIWYTLVYRGLMSVVPGSWAPASSAFENNMQHAQNSDIQGPADLMRLMNVSNLDVLGSADLWIGAAIGAAFIALAIYLRRWRELAD
ncbi:ABC transporter permease [Pseudoxanthomonas gei]|uniref:ABC transporter permease n=1 Tax=Pseudoxanthomonas gei TaxID=1383030 RepID=A0ABX0A9D9_9GAMM|nr:ABC transporter permease [Pseudoxanthomonas gei]NDK37267.1 ABC transporter permease [Pseudoxanthomonas gei]